MNGTPATIDAMTNRVNRVVGACWAGIAVGAALAALQLAPFGEWGLIVQVVFAAVAVLGLLGVFLLVTGRTTFRGPDRPLADPALAVRLSWFGLVALTIGALNALVNGLSDGWTTWGVFMVAAWLMLAAWFARTLALARAHRSTG